MDIIQQYEPILAIAIGIFLCLFGYRIKKVAFIVIWFIIGYYLMSLVVGNITQDPTWQQILPIGAGLVLGVLGFSIEKFCIFAVATFTVATTLIDLFQMTEIIPIALAIAAGVIVGCIAVAFIKPVGIITTALSGAKLIAKYTVSSLALSHEPYFLIILAACFAIGCLYQFKSNRHIG
jgi:hypothetical protein